MNRIVKPALLVLGLAAIGYASFWKLRINSAESRWERVLTNDAQDGNMEGLTAHFRATIDGILTGWHPAIFLGLLIFGAACLIQTKDADEES